MTVQNYGELKTAIQLWIDRDDEEVVNRIPLFINMAEKEIYRQIRIPAFEFTLRQDPLLDGTYPIPRDLVRLKYITIPDQNIWFEQISYPTWFGLRQGRVEDRYYPNQYFARKEASYYVYPAQDGPIDITYWRDVPELKQDSDTNALLSIAPDLFIYMSCKHAMNYIADDQRALMFNQLASQLLDEIYTQVEDDELGGSSLTVPYVEVRY